MNFISTLSGAADLSSQLYHPACFVSDDITTAEGYGVCMVEEIVKHTEYNGSYVVHSSRWGYLGRRN